MAKKSHKELKSAAVVLNGLTVVIAAETAESSYLRAHIDYDARAGDA